MVEQWPFKPWVGGSNPSTLISVAIVAVLLGAPAIALAEDAAVGNAGAAADAIAAGKAEEAAAHLGKLLTFDLAPPVWVDAHFALLCLRPADLERLLSRVEKRPWMLDEDLSRMPDLVRRLNRDPSGTAELIATRLDKSPDDPVLLNLLASACESMGRGDEAEAGYEKARKAAGKAVCFWINFPQVSLSSMRRKEGRDDDAFLLDREAITWLTPLPDPREALAREGLAAGVRAIRDVAYFRTQLAMALSNVGCYEAKRGRHAAAIESYGKSLAIEPRDARTLANLAVARYDSGDARGALEAIEAALRCDPKNGEYEKEREIILAKLEGR